MPGPPTPILGLTVPTVGGDNGIWGTELNADLAILDNLGALSTVAVAVNYIAPVPVFPEAVILATGGAGGISVTLPAPASCKGRAFLIKKVDAAVGVITVTPFAGLIDGQLNYLLPNQYQYVRVLSDGANYNVIGNT
jgi:hypothetical protein